jgi:hypothetical protein
MKKKFKKTFKFIYIKTGFTMTQSFFQKKSKIRKHRSLKNEPLLYYVFFIFISIFLLTEIF